MSTLLRGHSDLVGKAARLSRGRGSRRTCALRAGTGAPPALKRRGATGSALVGVLWCLALLSIVVIGVLHTARTDLQVGRNFGDRIQAHYLALAGIEKAKALLYHDARERTRTSRSHSGNLYDSPEEFRDVRLGRGLFRVMRRGRPDEGGGILYGVNDEESRLNVNSISIEDLKKLEGMTPDVAAAIVDWRDRDNQVSPGGAEAEYYASLQPASQPRNGPFETVRELQMVRGVSRDLLLGRDRHQNGLLDLGAEEGQGHLQDSADLGWAGVLTVSSAVENVNAAGEDRVNVQTADETALRGVRGITAEIAKAIVAYRGQHRFESIADLLDVTAAQSQSQPASPRPQVVSSPGEPAPTEAPPAGPAPQQEPGTRPPGAKVISEELLLEIGDEVTVEEDGQLHGVVNINTASAEVLACLPGLNRELSQAVVAYRQSSGFFANTAYLLRVPGVRRDLFKQLASRVTARSETYRILSEGRVLSSGARRRLEEVVHVGLHRVSTVSCREDDL